MTQSIKPRDARGKSGKRRGDVPNLENLTLSELVESYVKEHKPRLDRELDHFGNRIRTLEAVIEQAGRAEVLHHHQGDRLIRDPHRSDAGPSCFVG